MSSHVQNWKLNYNILLLDNSQISVDKNNNIIWIPADDGHGMVENFFGILMHFK